MLLEFSYLEMEIVAVLSTQRLQKRRKKVSFTELKQNPYQV